MAVGQSNKAKVAEQPRDESGHWQSKLTPDIRQQIVDALRAGAPPEVACAYAGIVRQTYYNWLERGRAAISAANGNLPEVLAENEYAQLVSAVDTALAQFVVGNMTAIGLAGRQEREGQWQALAWQLERRFPAFFGRKTRHEITGKDGGPIQIENAIILPPGALDRLPLERKLLLAEILSEIEGEVIEAEPLALEAGS